VEAVIAGGHLPFKGIEIVLRLGEKRAGCHLLNMVRVRYLFRQIMDHHPDER